MSVLTLRPNADGHKGLDTSTGTDHYALIDEETLSETDYVKSGNLSALYDDYGFPNHSSESGTINSLTIKVYCKKVIKGTDTNTVSIRPLVTIGGTKYYGDAQNPATSTTLYSKAWTVNPATSSAWSWTNIDDLIAGLEIDADYIDKNNYITIYCYQLWVEVDYGASGVVIPVRMFHYMNH